MFWIGLVLMIVHAYQLQLVQAQELFRARKMSILDANLIILRSHNVAVRCVVTFSSLATLVAAVVLLVVSARWWTPLWVLLGYVVGRLLIWLTANPLLGETPRDRWFNK
jgi:hypothetical protein